MKKNRLIAITIIRDEENNFLNDWLQNIGQIADYHIFLDDASNDNTPEIVARHLETHPGELHRRKTSLFRENEPALRAQLWDFARRVARNGDWILIVDADEFYDENMRRLKKQLLRNKFPDIDVVKVSCLDMWTRTSYRVDGHWSPVKSDVRLIRYRNVPFGANGKNLHMPPYPASTDLTKNLDVYVPKVHLAYLRKSDRVRRYNFYKENVDPSMDKASYKHALSILDKGVQLNPYVKFILTLRAIISRNRLYLHIRKILRKYGDK